MKNISQILLALALSLGLGLGLAGCKDEQKENDKSATKGSFRKSEDKGW
ncbi:hypothetical protein [Pseudomonas sp. JZ134]